MIIKRDKTKQLTHRQQRFLTAYSNCGSIIEAARMTKIGRSRHYVWLDDPAYHSAFEVSHQLACVHLESEAAHRAMDGSDTILMFLLRHHRPNIYQDRSRKS